MTDTDPVRMWEYYLQLTEIEQAFKELKGDLATRPSPTQDPGTATTLGLRKSCSADLLTSMSKNQGFQPHNPLQSAKSG